MTRRHRLPLLPHPFLPSGDEAWNGEHRWCARSDCGMPKTHMIHTVDTEVEDDSNRILGEHDAA